MRTKPLKHNPVSSSHEDVKNNSSNSLINSARNIYINTLFPGFSYTNKTGNLVIHKMNMI